MYNKKALRGSALSLLIVFASFATIGATNFGIAEAADCAPMKISALKADGFQGANVPNNTLDNDLSSRWSSSGKGSWIELDVGQQAEVCNLDIAWYQGNERVYNFAIAVSKDASSYETIFWGKSSGSTNAEERYEFPDVTARSVKITVWGNSENNWASMTEIDVRGFDGTSTPTSPTIAFTNVAEASLLSGSNVVVVSASNPEMISRIDLYVDSSFIKTEYNDPYEFGLDTTRFTDGTHSLKAVAEDTSGNLITESETVSFENEPTPTDPTTTIAFANIDVDSVLAGSYMIEVTASNPEMISRIDLYVDSSFIKTEYNDPYEFGLDTTRYADGGHSIRAVARDTSGNEITETETISFKNAQELPTSPPASGGKYLLATMLQYVNTDTLVGIYQPNMASSDKPRIHVGLNKQITGEQLDGLLGLPGQHGAEYFSLAEIKANSPLLKAKGIEVIDYDLEPGDGHSPTSDLNDPLASIKAASQAAHANGLLFRCSPSRAITTSYGAQMAPYCDQFHIQAQALQDRPSEYESYVEGMVAKLRAANPDIEISVQVSTQRAPAGGMTLLETMKTDFARVADKVDGVSVWFSNDEQALSVLESFSEWFDANYRG